MLFAVGIESPSELGEAFGLVIPSLCNDKYSCFTCADDENDIKPMATDAIYSILDSMVENDDAEDFFRVVDEGFIKYKNDPNYSYCDFWILLDLDISEFLGKKRINISIPKSLVNSIDNFVKMNNSIYKDRSHFLSVVARKELSKY